MWPATALTAAVVVLSATPMWQFTHWQWIALALVTPVVLGLGAPVLRTAGAALRLGRIGTDVLVAAAPLAAVGWSVHELLVGEAGDPGFTQSLADRTLALDVAAVLTVVALTSIDDRQEHPAPTLLVAGCAVAVLGFGFGSGSEAVAGATAVLIGGCPAALWVAARCARPPGGGRWTVTACPEVLRLAAPLYTAHPDHPLARAVTAAAGPDLPGVSDPDGEPATGLRGIVSELRDDVVVAHAVLAGPAEWLAAHGVDPGSDPGQQVLVAWDGVPRGRLELAPVMARAGRYVAVTGSITGAALAAAGMLGPAIAVVVPLATTVLVVAVGIPALVRDATTGRERRSRPIGPTAR